ncbi:MAG: sigma-70 family RNA polymerase sigma factor [Wenzhouxiangella sp.]|nr:MAG: sigma-70 family RNA polymerase sigma factor [Wenzhouxiangella sp.]
MSDITRLLVDSEDGPDLKAVFDRLYPELKQLARARLASLSKGQTITPTVLVHEAFMRLVQADRLDLSGRRHFFACAGRAMRNIIVDHLRASGAQKRGGDQVAITLTDQLGEAGPAESILDLDQALNELDLISPQQRELVELKFFAGLPVNEIAELMGISSRTAWREWQRARAFLHARVAEM